MDPLVKLTYDNLSRYTNSFSESKCISHSQFGKLYCTKFRHPGEEWHFVVKIWETGYNVLRLANEIILLRHELILSHPSMVPMYGFCADGEHLCAMYAFQASDSVYNLIPKDSFTWQQRIKVALGIASLLKFLHTGYPQYPPFVVRNLDAAHILLDENGYPRLCDFSMITGGILPDRTVDKNDHVHGCYGHMDPYAGKKGAYLSLHSSLAKVEIVQKIQVDGEVNRARCMPQNEAIVASKTNGTEVFVFDCTKQLLNTRNGCSDPDLRLKGHEKEGYGLSYSPSKDGYLLSGSNDCRICLWDISAMAQDKVLEAKYIYVVMNYLSFNPFNEWVLATASSDTTVGLFDIRNLSSPLHALSSHMEEVFQVEWDPNHETVLASSADDGRLMVWDVNRVGDEQLEGEAEDGPPEHLFSHGGHKAKISDFSWNKNQAWVISSVAEDNTAQVWQMAESIYRDEG